MDSLIAIGAGLGLRALIDSVAHQTVQATALVGLWEGIVLNHFLGKFPSSLDPYLAFAFRLFVDFFFTESLTRMTIIVLWTVLGMLLADVAIQMSLDSRFRRLGRRVKRALSLSSSGSYPRSTSSRVRFLETPGSSSTSDSRTNTALLSSDSPSTRVHVLRPTATPFPGQFDQWSEASAPSRLEPLGTRSESASQVSGSDNLPGPIRPPTPSELEYITLPVIPDRQEPGSPVAGPSSRPYTHVDVTPRSSYAAKRADPNDDKPAANSGLTTPISGPRSPLRPVDDEDRPRVHSGLTTPEYLHAPLQPPPTNAPVGSKTAMKQPAPVRLTLAEASPIAFPEPQLTPMVIPPASEIPNIPTPDDVLALRPANDRTPPPSFQEAMKAASAADDVSSVGESVIAGKRDTIIAKADELRQKAKEQEAERDRLRDEIRKAQKEKRYFDIVCLQVELEEAQENIEQLHAKAARRYYKGWFFIDLQWLRAPDDVWLQHIT